MHAHIYIQCTREAKMKFSCILKCKERRKWNVCRQWLCNGRREHLEILAYYGGNSPYKGILEKLKGEKRVGSFIPSPTNWNPKYLITYSRLRPYINPKSTHGHARKWSSCMRPCTGMTQQGVLLTTSHS